MLPSSRECLSSLRPLLLTPLPPRIGIGYIIAYISFIPFIWKQRNQLRKDPHSLQPEARLYWLLFSTSRSGP